MTKHKNLQYYHKHKNFKTSCSYGAYAYIKIISIEE